ncbi:MAG: nucleotide exchange factor GrpE [Anaerolineae bacterium]|jgi:molecular chaperone GrpE
MEERKGDNGLAAEEVPDAAPGAEQEEVAVAAEEQEAPVEEAPSALEVLREELETCQEKQAEYLDGWQRARAELANARKRFQREQEQAYANARAEVLVRLLPVVDDFQRAFENMPDRVDDAGWLGGIRLIRQKLQNLLDQEGVTVIETDGERFDPFYHEAVSYEPSGDVPEGHVISDMQTGYRMGERVLRPSMVRVSSGPPVPPEAGEAAGSDEPETTEADERDESE